MSDKTRKSIFEMTSEEIETVAKDRTYNMDNYVIYPQEIIGTVKIKVPYIGLPTIWLNQLFS